MVVFLGRETVLSTTSLSLSVSSDGLLPLSGRPVQFRDDLLLGFRSEFRRNASVALRPAKMPGLALASERGWQGKGRLPRRWGKWLLLRTKRSANWRPAV